jgi:hypothetical protein
MFMPRCLQKGVCVFTRRGEFCGHLGFGIMRDFAEILQNFAYFAEILRLLQLCGHVFTGLRKICGQPEIAKKISGPKIKNLISFILKNFINYVIFI